MQGVVEQSPNVVDKHRPLGMLGVEHHPLAHSLLLLVGRHDYSPTANVCHQHGCC